jgi:hypothetical protein
MIEHHALLSTDARRASGDNTATQTGRAHDCTDKMTAKHRQKTPAMQELSKHTFMMGSVAAVRLPQSGYSARA